MNRRFKALLFVALIAAMVLGTAAVAIAAPALTLSSTRASVTYPQPTWLKLVAADNGVAVATTVTIQYRPIGTDVWKKLKTVSAKRAGEGTVTVPVSPYRLKSITGFPCRRRGTRERCHDCCGEGPVVGADHAVEWQGRACGLRQRLHLAAARQGLTPRRGDAVEVGRPRLG